MSEYITELTIFGVKGGKITRLYNFLCNARTKYRTLQSLVSYQKKLQGCTTFGVMREQMTGL